MDIESEMKPREMKKKKKQRKLLKSKSSNQNHKKKKRKLIISLVPDEAERNEKKKKNRTEKMKKKIKIKIKKLRSLEVEHYLCCCAESRAGKSEQSRERRSQPLCRERRCRCAECAAVQREQRPATSELEASLTEASSELD